MKSLSRVRPLATPWTAAYHAPPSMGLSRQEYWSGVPLPSPSQSIGVTYRNRNHLSRAILKAHDQTFMITRKKEMTFLNYTF